MEAARYLCGLVADLAPPDAVVGSVTEWTTGVFLPDSSTTSASDFVASIRKATEEDDLELEEGEWAEIRVAVGVVPVAGGPLNAFEVTSEAAHLAQADLRRFPSEWKFPIYVPDN